tara:strand:- start:2169 stop:2525 length:357 start_codon:yes stop_codon:yes gene_type:complete
MSPIGNPMGGCATCGEQSVPETEIRVPDVSNFLSDNMFIIYSMNGCNYCEKVKELMRLTKQQYVVYTLDQHFTIENFEDEFNTRTFPQIVLDNRKTNKRKRIGGAAELALFFKENSPS